MIGGSEEVVTFIGCDVIVRFAMTHLVSRVDALSLSLVLPVTARNFGHANERTACENAHAATLRAQLG